MRSRGWRCDKCAKTNVEDLPDPESTPISNDLPIRSTSQDEEPTPVPTDASAIVHEAAAEAIPVTLVSIEGQPQSPIPEPARSTPSSLETIAPPTSISPRAPASLNAAVVSMKALRPPVLLDTAICVLVVLVAALLYRRIL
jgi:ubiquitin-conjugating enzyme E2 J1